MTGAIILFAIANIALALVLLGAAAVQEFPLHPAVISCLLLAVLALLFAVFGLALSLPFTIRH